MHQSGPCLLLGSVICLIILYCTLSIKIKSSIDFFSSSESVMRVTFLI